MRVLLIAALLAATTFSASGSAIAQSAAGTKTDSVGTTDDLQSTKIDSTTAAATQLADTVLFNGAIYTVDACRRWANAVAIKDGKFIYVGDDAQARQLAGEGTRLVDLHGHMVLPGFHDCHVHPAESGIQLGQCCLDQATSKSEVLKAISAYDKKHAQAKWLVGGGWELPVFAGANPLRSDLDAVVADKPAFLVSQDGHSAWINSKAMNLAGITRATKDPPLGRIERDKNGEPSGTLRESAVDLVSKLVPPVSDEERVEGARRAIRLANSFGITSVQDAHAQEEYLKAYAQLEKQGELTMRLTAALHTDPGKGSEQVANLVRLRNSYTSDLIKPTSAKIFADGVIESHTAALLDDYSDRPGYKGILNFTPQAMRDLVLALDKAKFQVHVHAIGDAAIHCALDAFAAARQINGVRDSRHQIAHLELIAPGDIVRFRDLNVIANFEPLWAFRDKYISEYTEPLLGAQRSKRLYQIHTVMKTGAVVSAGSDWSVTSLNPLEAIQVGITRRALDDDKSPPWLMHERVDLTDLLAAYTINGAYANHEESIVGSIEPGKAADFIVLDHNLFAIAAGKIHNTKVLMTYFNGNCVYKGKE